jgi:hypothetical protein
MMPEKLFFVKRENQIHPQVGVANSQRGSGRMPKEKSPPEAGLSFDAFTRVQHRK